MVVVALLLSIAVLATAVSLLNGVKAAPNETRCASGRQHTDNIAADAQAAAVVDGHLGTTSSTAVGAAVSAQSDGTGLSVSDTGCKDSTHAVYVPLAAPAPMPT